MLWTIPLIIPLEIPTSRFLFVVDQRDKFNDILKQFIDELKSNERDLADMWNNAAMNIDKSQAQNKLNFDWRYKMTKNISKVTLVMITDTDFTPGVNKKWIPKFHFVFLFCV